MKVVDVLGKFIFIYIKVDFFFIELFNGICVMEDLGVRDIML